MNGAESLVRTLVGQGVDMCFANPGTSEMHLVQAIDGADGLRPVLALFEGVCTGAADGYGRMRGKPAATLLHLGAGLGNGIANLHNARRAGTPLVNLVGDHAIHHVPYDAPLTSDVEGVARPVSAWVRTSRSGAALARDGADAVIAAMTPRPNPLGGIATLIVPADCAWGVGVLPPDAPAAPAPGAAASESITAAAAALSPDAVLLLDAAALSEAGIEAAGAVAAATGCRLMSPTFPARVEGGPGLPAVARLPYFPEQVQERLARTQTLVLAGAEPPVSFFAYPETPSSLVPSECRLLRLCHRHEDCVGALEALAAEVSSRSHEAMASDATGSTQRSRPAAPEGALSTRTISQALGALVPDGAVIAVDSGGGGAAYPVLQSAARHTWLNLTGGAIGQGGPVATGAAVACPDRPAFALLGDGGALYTLQCLWTQAREQLNVTTVIYANRAYNILEVEYRRLGVNAVGDKAASLFDLSSPDIDWVKLSEGMGVPARRTTSADEFVAALGEAVAQEGPRLIEARL